ncbi:MAG: CNNM domain-containing protein, partial [Eubacteriales bacterium]|nr:CNNM domain-containing protein [Eubacteriales bacterium]
MDSSDIFLSAVLLILIILSGLFSKIETAYTGVSRVKIRAMADSQDIRALRVLTILDNYSDMLSSILIGNNIVNLSASAISTSLTIKLVGNAMVGISTGIITFVILIFGEIIPKRQAAADPEIFALKYSGFLYIYIRVLKPLVWIVERISRGIAFLFHLNVNNAEAVITEEELKTYVEVSHEDGAIETDEMEFIHNVFDFGDATAKDIMIPRIEMETVDSGVS